MGYGKDGAWPVGMQSQGRLHGCFDFGMTPLAIAPAAHVNSGGREIMNAKTKRTVIAAAALGAAGLFGSLPFDGASVAQQGVPVQHHDVALVDTASPLDTVIGYETSLDDSLYSGLYSSTGLYAELYNGAVTALGAHGRGHTAWDHCRGRRGRNFRWSGEQLLQRGLPRHVGS